MFDLLNISEQIQLLSASVSSLIAVISIIIAIATLRQTKKITEESNRPYVAVYLEAVQVTGTVVNFIVLKNFGSVGALIDSITYSPVFNSEFGGNPFSTVSNHFIAPGQSLTSACKFIEPFVAIEFKISYKNGKKSYNDSFVINPKAVSTIVFSKVTPGGANGLEKVIAHSFQELIRTKL